MGIIGKTLRFTLGLALGAAVGAVGALVVAPQSGRITQGEIKKRIDSILQAGKDAQAQRQQELQEYWEQTITKKDDEDKDKKK